MKNVFLIIALVALAGACSDESYVVSTDGDPEIASSVVDFTNGTDALGKKDEAKICVEKLRRFFFHADYVTILADPPPSATFPSCTLTCGVLTDKLKSTRLSLDLCIRTCDVAFGFSSAPCPNK